VGRPSHLGGCTADADRHVGAVQRCVHELDHARARRRNLLHDLLVDLGFLVLQADVGGEGVELEERV
jgi:hypothetical protein